MAPASHSSPAPLPLPPRNSLRRRLSLPLRSIARRRSFELQPTAEASAAANNARLIAGEAQASVSMGANENQTGNGAAVASPLPSIEEMKHSLRSPSVVRPIPTAIRTKMFTREDSSSVGSAYDADSTTERSRTSQVRCAIASS